MPILKGRIKHARGKRPRGTRVRQIRPTKELGGGGEGDVFEAVVSIPYAKKWWKTRKVVMAVKRFKAPFQKVRLQFKIMNEIIALNRKKKLGLRITPTIRIVKRFFRLRPDLVLTKLSLAKYPGKGLTPKQNEEFLEDRSKQLVVLAHEGYHSSADAFFPQVDPKTGKGIAIIGDFGNVSVRSGKRPKPN